MSSWDERWQAEQQQLVDARNHLASCEQWAQNALSMAENDGREQAAAAIFRAGSDSKSYRSTCRRCIGDSGIDQSFATAPLPPDRCRILPWKITVKGLPEGTRLGAPLTVIFARRQDARREEDGPVRSCRHGHWGALRTDRLPAGAGMPTGGSAAPGGLPPVGRGWLPPRCRPGPPTFLLSFGGTPSCQLALPSMTSASRHVIRPGRGPPGAPPRALEDVEKVVTGREYRRCPVPGEA